MNATTQPDTQANTQPDTQADTQLDLKTFRGTVREFVDRAIVPYRDEWRRQGFVSRDLWTQAGGAGLLCVSTPADVGGRGGTLWHEFVLIEELARVGFLDFGVWVHNTIVAPYIQRYAASHLKRAWLTSMAAGDLVGALALTEPGCGSDLQAMRTTASRVDGGYLLNGQKTLISNGRLGTLIVVGAKVTSNESSGGRSESATDATSDGRSDGLSLFVVETERKGFRRGRTLAKVGLHAQDTSELFFDDVFVETDRLLGARNSGLLQLLMQLPRERLIIAMQAVAVMDAAIDETLRHVRQRRAFGRSVADFQHTRFALASAKTEAAVARAFVEDCTARVMAGLHETTITAMAKLWATEAAGRTVDACLQLFGGYGYLEESPIARMWLDARVQRIYGGTSEIMKEIIAESL
jgi:acyl-CoA dehydrogenase